MDFIYRTYGLVIIICLIFYTNLKLKKKTQKTLIFKISLEFPDQVNIKDYDKDHLVLMLSMVFIFCCFSFHRNHIRLPTFAITW